MLGKRVIGALVIVAVSLAATPFVKALTQLLREKRKH